MRHVPCTIIIYMYCYILLLKQSMAPVVQSMLVDVIFPLWGRSRRNANDFF